MILRTIFPVVTILLSISAGCKKQVPVETSASLETSGSATSDVPTPAQQIARNFERVSFEFDSDTLTVSGRQALDENARIFAENTEIRVQVQGHCDDRGTTDYNMALGEKRALAVRKCLVAAGVAPSRVETISFGEERPLAAGDGEYAWAQNRRAEFLVTNGDPSLVVGTTR